MQTLNAIIKNHVCIFIVESRFIKEIVCAQTIKSITRHSLFLQVVAILHLILREEGKSGKYV